MRKFVLLVACQIIFFTSVNPGLAQTVPGWVSTTGSDSNGCTQALPCLTFQKAVTTGYSQVNCIGSGNYGPVTITASVTIDCGAGNIGNIAPSTGSAITINTTAPATIILRHLSLVNTGSAGANGIDAGSFFDGKLIIEDCDIHRFNQGSSAGVYFVPSSGRGLLQVANSEIFDNTYGIVVSPPSSQIASVTLDHVKMTANSAGGLYFGGAGVVAGTMRDSISSSNGTDGLQANAGQVYFTVEESSIVANLRNGIYTTTQGSNLNVTASTISANGTGVAPSAGSIISFGNNTLNGNGADGNFTSTKALK